VNYLWGLVKKVADGVWNWLRLKRRLLVQEESLTATIINYQNMQKA